MLHVFLAFVVLGNKLQYLELNYDCLFVYDLFQTHICK